MFWTCGGILGGRPSSWASICPTVGWTDAPCDLCSLQSWAEAEGPGSRAERPLVTRADELPSMELTSPLMENEEELPVWKWKKNKILFSETRCWPAGMFKCLCSTLIKFKPTTLTLFITCHVVSSTGSKCNVICENLSLKKSFQFHSFFLGKQPLKAFVFCVRYSI